MVETGRLPRWLTILAGLLLILLGLWFWLDHAFRAPDVVPVLLQQTDRLAPIEAVSPASVASTTPSLPSNANAPIKVPADAATPTVIAIDCRTPETATDQVSEWVDDGFGAELTELVLSGAVTWFEQHPMTVREDWSSNHGVGMPSGYAAYSDSTLRAAADNGDALAAAIFGAKQVQAIQNEMFKLTPEALQSKLVAIEPYLLRGMHGNISGVWQFYLRAAEIRATRSRVREGAELSKVYSDRAAVIEYHARVLASQLYGAFEERVKAHLALTIPDVLPALNDEQERGQMLDRARSLKAEFAEANLQRPTDERRAENAVVALLNAGMKQMKAFDAMRCADGRPLAEVLPDDAFDGIAKRYGLPI